jgi:selenocysteine lyase/cysteine desulfurase
LLLDGIHPSEVVMMIDRRQFLSTSATVSAGLVLGSTEATASDDLGPHASWEQVRDLFELRRDRIHMSGLLFASHPKPVREAIAKHRDELQRDPASYISHERWRLEGEVLKSASSYLGVTSTEISLTDSTSMGLGLLYSGLKLTSDDEVLTTNHDHYAVESALLVCRERTGCAVSRIDMYRDSATATAVEIVESVRRALSPATRLVAVTWVHSGTGLKIPIRAIADAIADANRSRSADRRIYLAVDGVHALGVEDFTLSALGCDFFAAGTHKWLFGPRGTGFLWGRTDAWDITRATIPTWEPGVFYSLIGWRERPQIGGGQLMTPGGYHAFDHTWAVGSAFDMHAGLGKTRVTERIHDLNRELKEGMRAMPHVQLATPMAPDLSAGIVCFDVDGMSAEAVVNALGKKGIVASRTPYRRQYARLCPGLLTPGDDVARTLAAVRALA